MAGVRYTDGKKLRTRQLDLTAMSGEGIKWFVSIYNTLSFGSSKLIDAVSLCTERVQLRLNSSIVFHEKILDEYKTQNTLISVQDINEECDEIKSKLKLFGKIENNIKLGEDTHLKQNNAVKMKDLMMEREREECEIKVEKMLNELGYLKKNFENRRIEMGDNINKFGQINIMDVELKSSMNVNIVQGYPQSSHEYPPPSGKSTFWE